MRTRIYVLLKFLGVSSEWERRVWHLATIAFLRGLMMDVCIKEKSSHLQFASYYLYFIKGKETGIVFR